MTTCSNDSAAIPTQMENKNNKFMAYAGGISNIELNMLEIVLLKILNFEVRISENVFTYHKILLINALQNEQS